MLTTELVHVPDAQRQLATLDGATQRAREFISQSKASATKRAYASDWRHFEQWCAQHGRQALPATGELVALYLSDLADSHKPATLTRRLSSISQAHASAGYESPSKHVAARSVLEGIRRNKGVAQKQKAPILTDDLRKMVNELPTTLAGHRNRALLLLGFAGAFRRSELVGLDTGDGQFTNDGVAVTLRRSKTDQEGAGRTVGIPYGSHPATCPVRALRAWLDCSGITEGPMFRSVNRHDRLQVGRLDGRAVALVVKRYAEAVGKDGRDFGGHSLRAGMVTQAAMNRAPRHAIKKQTGHKSDAMLDRYIRAGSLFEENASAFLGL